MGTIKSSQDFAQGCGPILSRSLLGLVSPMLPARPGCVTGGAVPHMLGWECACESVEGKFMRVFRWGDSLAIQLPAAVVESLGLREGDDVMLHVAGERIFEMEKTSDARERLARLRRFRGRLPKDFKFERC